MMLASCASRHSSSRSLILPSSSRSRLLMGTHSQWVQASILPSQYDDWSTAAANILKRGCGYWIAWRAPFRSMAGPTEPRTGAERDALHPGSMRWGFSECFLQCDPGRTPRVADVVHLHRL